MHTDTDATIDAWRTLVHAHARLIRVFEGRLKSQFSLDRAQYDALRWLTAADGGRLRTQDLAESLLYSSGAATKVADRLVARGLAARIQDSSDRRVSWVQLTPEGEKLAAQAFEMHRAHVVAEIGPFASAEEKQHVQAYLTRLAGPSGWPANG